MIRLLSTEEQRGKKKSPPPSFPAAGAPLSRAGGLFRSLGISTIILEAEPADERERVNAAEKGWNGRASHDAAVFGWARSENTRAKLSRSVDLLSSIHLRVQNSSELLRGAEFISATQISP